MPRRPTVKEEPPPRGRTLGHQQLAPALRPSANARQLDPLELQRGFSEEDALAAALAAAVDARHRRLACRAGRLHCQ